MRNILLLAMLCLSLGGFCQSRTPLTIGEAFPYQGELHFQNGDVKKIEDFAGKPTIIELFSSTCIVCFEMLPKVDKLAKDFGGQVQFVLVGIKDNTIEKTFQKFKTKLDLHLTPAFDIDLFRSIKYNAVPTYIWLDKDGKIAAVTEGAADMNAENLKDLIAGEQLSFGQPIKKKLIDFSVPYLLNGNGNEVDGYLFRSILARWDPSLPYRFPYDLSFDSSTKCINMLGLNLQYLYQYAYLGTYAIDRSDSRYGKVWPKPIIEDNYDETAKYCYSLSYQTGKAPDPVKTLQNELRNCFGYTVGYETREMPCWVLTATKKAFRNLKTKATKPSWSATQAGFDYHRVPMSDIIGMICIFESDPSIPFLDETGIDFPIDLQLDALLTQEAEVVGELEKSGLILKKTQRPMEVLVLKPNTGLAQGAPDQRW